MANEKRYYWLKLQHDFFDSKRIKKLRNLAGGDTFTIIYLKMQLKALTSNGVLEYSGLEPTFAEEIALDIDENSDNVAITIDYLFRCGLLEMTDESHAVMPFVIDNTGSETASAQRGRDYRLSLTDEEIAKERERARIGMRKTREARRNVTECYERVTNVEIEKSKSKSQSKSIFSPPSVDDVRAYCNERRNSVDPERFVDYYAARGWVLSNKKKMADWKAAVRTWEKNRYDSKDHPREAVRGTDYNAMVENELMEMMT